MKERLYFAWYLLPAAEVERRTRGVIAHTGWTRAERVEMSRQWTLQGFGSPSELGADEFPAGNPHGAVLWVAAERYSEHLHEYAQAGWLLADDTGADSTDWSHIVTWESPALVDLRNAPAAPDEPPLLPEEPYSSIGPTRPAARTWEPTVQSGMRSGLMAGFLDGITGGGFFDF
jgi:hypothetical protein